jgi:CO/xanthine dehydrogenase FAD-binding subunit
VGVYLRPQELDQALDALRTDGLSIVAGGTDFYPARVGQPIDDDVLDISAVAGLRAIEDRGDHWHLGALTTWTDIATADLPPCFDGLKLAAREVGGVQIQNAGTLCGNICNASPAADGAPNLLALDAQVVLASTTGERTVPLGEFITGNRATVRRSDEMVVALTVPKPAPGARSAFLKLGARRYQVISIVMVALVIESEASRVAGARVAVGACAPVARRLSELEAALIGAPMHEALGEVADASHLTGVLAPIDDLRGTADYRLDAALTLIRRGLSALGSER